MKFRDFTLFDSMILTRRDFDTDTLNYGAIEACQQMLSELRHGAEFVEHGIETVPRFGVHLGPPNWLAQDIGEAVEAPGRFFCIAEPDHLEFQINLILPETSTLLSEIDDRAVATILGLSLAGDRSKIPFSTEEQLEQCIREITQSRPGVSTVLLPYYDIDRTLVMIAADFATYFAAALFLEETS